MKNLLLSLGLIFALTLSIAIASDNMELKRSLAPKVPFSQFPFAALIVASSSGNSIEYVCSGSVLDKSAKSHILTTAFCIQERQDQSGNPIQYKVLIEDTAGNVTLGSSTFSQFDVDKAFPHPNASRISEFVFTSQFPNGTAVNFNVAVAPNDIGILRLTKSLSSMLVTPVELSKTIPASGDPVRFVGYGGPNFFSLGATVGTEVIPSQEISGTSSIQNGKLIFMRDARPNVLPNETQSVEPGDEGSPMLDSNNRQVGIVVGSWQVNPNTTDVITFATLGPAISPNIEFIDSVIRQQPVGTSDAVGLLINFVAVVAALAVVL